jgi:dienelactone hydrolase
MARLWWPRRLAAAVVLSGLVACSPTPPAAPPAPPPSSAEPSASPSVTFVPLEQQCAGATIPKAAKQRTVVGPDGSLINTASWGTGSTTAILLHQTDGNGLCGFLLYGDYLARRGVRVMAVDLCGYGQSVCQRPLSTDAVAQVRSLAEAARSAGAKRVVLIGASMGGSLAVTAAAPVKAAAVVDLSGPADFDISHISTDARTVTMPALIAFGRDTDPIDLAAVRAQLKAMPTKRKKLLVLQAGHGYDLLHVGDSTKPTKLAAQVLAWIRR